jgi:O-antigen/teichoic acid export membrane protein
VYSFALIPLAFFTVFTSILRGVQKMTSYASLNFIMGVVQVVVIFIFAHHGLNIVNLAYLLLGIQTTGAALAGLFCMVAIPYFWKNLHFSTHKFYSISRACLPVAMIAILGILHQKTSLTMLSFMGSASMAGVFSAAARVVEAAQIGHFVILTALYPVLANAHRDRTIRSTFRFSWILFLAVSTGASVLLFLLARPIVDLFFVRQYQPSIVVLRILAFTLIPYTVNSFLSTFLLAQKQERVILRVLGVSLFMLLVLNFILIPMNGQIGASWATLVAAIAQSMLFVWAWMGNPLRRMDSPPLKGTSYELSDLS